MSLAGLSEWSYWRNWTRLRKKILRAIAAKNQKCFAIESHCGDAREFQFPAEPTVLYLFNPFPEHVLRTVLANLRESMGGVARDASSSSTTTWFMSGCLLGAIGCSQLPVLLNTRFTGRCSVNSFDLQSVTVS